MDKISVIIPIYNREEIFIHTINSLIKQTYSNWECVIIDDQSKDNTYRALLDFTKSDSRFKILQRPINIKKGPSSCRNIGIESATGNFLIFLDSDDLLTENCLKQRLKFANDNPNFDLWIFKTNYLFSFNNDFSKLFNKQIESYSNFCYLDNFLRNNVPFCITSPFWRRNSLLKLSGFDKNLRVLEDPDIHIRAFEDNLKSCTCLDCDFDHLYVQNKVKNVDYNLLCLNYFYFCNKHILKNKHKIINYINEGIKYSIKAKNSIVYLKFLNLLMANNLFFFKLILGSLLLFFINIIGLQSIKGIGYNRLVKFTFG